MSTAAPAVIGLASLGIGARVREWGRIAVARAGRLGVEARFALVGVTVAVLVASALAWFVEARVTEFAHAQLKARAVDQVKLGVQGHVEPSDFEAPYTPEKLDDLAERLHPLLSRAHEAGSGVIRLHLFARDGTIIYSDVLDKRGYVANLATSPVLALAFEGEVNTKISTLSSSKTAELKARYGEALEVYVPFVLDGQVLGAYEIYQDLAPIRPIRPMVWGTVLAGFTVLMLSLFAVVRWAAGVIRRQQVEREAALAESAEAERRGLRASEARFRSLVANASDVILILGADGVVRYESPSAAHTWGYAEDALHGRDLADIVHAEDLAAARDVLTRTLASPGTEIEAELRLRRADGAWRDMEVVAKNLVGQAGIDGIVVTFHDVTERAHATEALREYAVQLERSNRELQNFAYVASHDLQEPLRKIQAFADRLVAKYRDDLGTEGCDYLGRMQAAAARMQAMINDLLALSRVATQDQPAVPVSLETVAREVISDLEARLEQTGGSVEIGELPTIDGNALQLRQLLQNLIGNALKFRREGEPPVVRVGADRISATRIRLTVADNGIGFDEKYLDKIFAPFQRLHGRGAYEGTGIGLAICQKIVQRHGGTITARSTPGEGTTFIVALPLAQHTTSQGAAA